jgi:hypothetical protein
MHVKTEAGREGYFYNHKVFSTQLTGINWMFGKKNYFYNLQPHIYKEKST